MVNRCAESILCHTRTSSIQSLSVTLWSNMYRMWWCPVRRRLMRLFIRLPRQTLPKSRPRSTRRRIRQRLPREYVRCNGNGQRLRKKTRNTIYTSVHHQSQKTGYFVPLGRWVDTQQCACPRRTDQSATGSLQGYELQRTYQILSSAPSHGQYAFTKTYRRYHHLKPVMSKATAVVIQAEEARLRLEEEVNVAAQARQNAKTEVHHVSMSFQCRTMFGEGCPFCQAFHD